MIEKHGTNPNSLAPTVLKLLSVKCKAFTKDVKNLLFAVRTPHEPRKMIFFTSCKRTLEKTKLNFELNGTNPRSVVQMVCELQLFKGKPPFATNSVLACIKSNMKRNFFQKFVN